jgi:hypothetical protein
VFHRRSNENWLVTVSLHFLVEFCEAISEIHASATCAAPIENTSFAGSSAEQIT